ncbi:hypothetical protein CONCODRAFT_73941 [Conidiobolus coronatus NRRL 28638]|uniref:Uncharacterized protein n=1 Tax=Conidiobolus coronatus (strain ATCC 28846 / CBS 209.66 / NRRL 28638) TaxID=796925 RepID=A0A137NTF7_CONC2|nr:hypothetical protein CONCODRAFT_73941 [Conidiobolus coronatus NRRL 28638]|eukprot:KXN66040.1 hypothetical protein CONCODRAFT_73941 [Conidiobolus coronatus NRRL 28638]
MKFVLSTLLTLVSVAYCQQATVLHPKDKETKIGDGYKCYKNSTGIAKGVKGKSSIELQFFKNDNCDGKYYRKAWGTINFKKSFKYYSVKLEKHKKKKDTKSESVEEDTEESGAEEGVAEDDETSVKSVDESDTEAGEDDDSSGSEQNK